MHIDHQMANIFQVLSNECHCTVAPEDMWNRKVICMCSFSKCGYHKKLSSPYNFPCTRQRWFLLFITERGPSGGILDVSDRSLIITASKNWILFDVNHGSTNKIDGEMCFIPAHTLTCLRTFQVCMLSVVYASHSRLNKEPKSLVPRQVEEVDRFLCPLGGCESNLSKSKSLTRRRTWVF